MNILILCTGNSCRSQMAEGFLRSYLNEHSNIYSAGLKPQGVNPKAIFVMKESGIDISKQTSNDLNEYINMSFDHIITVCDNAAEKCPQFPDSGEKKHLPFSDPADASGSEEEILNVFRKVRDEISTKLKDWLNKLEQ